MPRWGWLWHVRLVRHWISDVQLYSSTTDTDCGNRHDILTLPWHGLNVTS